MSKIFTDEVHAKNVLQQLWQQCDTDKFCDVVLIAGAEGLKIPAHRAILSIASGYFKGMFESLCESTSKEVTMPSVDGDILKSLVEFCYTGSLEIREDIVQELLEEADMLLLTSAVTACANFLTEQLHPTNCLGVQLLAERYRCQSLLQHAKKYSLEHFMDVYKTEEFLSLSSEQLSQLLACNDLRVSAEEHVFSSIMTWIQHDQIEREQHKDTLLKLVRMPLLDPLFLFVNVKSICTSTECHQMYLEAMEWHSLKDRGILNASISTKSRMPPQILMGITVSATDKKMYVQYYCPQRLKWMKWLNYLEYRTLFGIAIMEHKLYIVGGLDAVGNELNTVICLNMKTMNSSPVQAMEKCRGNCRLVVMNGFLYAWGAPTSEMNFSVERWNPKTNTWNTIDSMSSFGRDYEIAVLNRKLHAIGGNYILESNITQYFDPHQNKWKSIAKMSEHRLGHAVVVANSLLYAVGGGESKSVERYDPETNKWTVLCSLRQRLIGYIPCTIFNDKVIVCYNNCVDEYNATTNEWIANTSLKGLPNIYCAFSYSDELLITEFAEN